MQVFTAQEWRLSTTQGGTTTTLLSNVSYSGAGGAAQELTGATLANGVYTEALSYDAMARPTESTLTRVSDGALLFDAQRAYDAVGNVANVWTTLPAGTDYQAFCYDEQNRLVWASSASGTVPCNGDPTWSAGTLAGATYTKTYSYDTLNRLTSGPGGSYTYGDPAHLDAATAITGSANSYTASYDAAGDMVCRAPTSATTCTGGSPSGAQMTYDNERRLASWQNAPGSTPTSSTSNLYDGEGQRVAQQVTNGGATTTVTYIGNLEELSTTAGATTTTSYYYAGGKRIAQAVNGAFTYLGSDGLGSAEVALDGSGNAQASALYDPYGNVRYSSGTMPGSYGYTGQRADAATGLDDYNARYYDPVAGQFTSADAVQDGLNRYAYVGGNPETATDPTGQRCVADGSVCPVGGGGSGGSGSGGSSGGSGGSTGGSGSGSGGGGTGSGQATHPGGHYRCQATWVMCAAITLTFLDPNTRNLLFLLTYSSLGRRFLPFLIQAGHMLGQLFITWGHSGTTNNAGFISLDTSIVAIANPDDPNSVDAGWISAAGGLIHEAVESFYSLADGVYLPASQHMDYVAEWFAGEVRSQLASSAQFGVDPSQVPGGSSFGLRFDKWASGSDGQLYSSEPVDQPEATTWWGAALAASLGHPWLYPDSMGLTMQMLSGGPTSCVNIGAGCSSD